MSLKDEAKNAFWASLIFSAMYWVGKKLDKGWLGMVFGRGRNAKRQ